MYVLTVYLADSQKGEMKTPDYSVGPFMTKEAAHLYVVDHRIDRWYHVTPYRQIDPA